MKRLATYVVLSTVILFVVTACTSTDKTSKQSQSEITISAASSVTDALEEIKTDYEQNHPVKIFVNYGSSGTLQKQIEQGAPTDIFISASSDKFTALKKKQLIDSTYETELLTNRLVLITPKLAEKTLTRFEDLTMPSISTIAIGIPASVPVGKYAKEALIELGLWEDLNDKLILAKDARQVLSYVETGNVEAGIVYRTDAARSEKVQIIAEASPELHSEIIYPAGIIEKSASNEATVAFFKFLTTDSAKKVFEKYGFAVK